MRRSELVILTPVLRRPQNVAPLLRSIGKATTRPYRVLFIADPDDRAEIAAIEPHVGAGVTLLLQAGNYARKINRGVEESDEPLIFTGADDLNFWPDWLEAAQAKLTEGIGVVGTLDLCNGRVTRGIHSTHSLVTRSYAELGTIDDSSRMLHEAYPHEFVDDEFIATAIYRQAFAHAHESVVEHLHPWVDKAPYDELYNAIRGRMRVGRRIFRAREHLWNGQGSLDERLATVEQL